MAPSSRSHCNPHQNSPPDNIANNNLIDKLSGAFTKSNCSPAPTFWAASYVFYFLGSTSIPAPELAIACFFFSASISPWGKYTRGRELNS